MPFRRLRRFLKQGELHFDKFGELDYGLMSLPKASTVFMDYDSPVDIPSIGELHSIARIIDISPVAVCYKRTRRGWHIAITFLERFTAIELIAIQAIYGDDPMRGALNFMRYWQSKGKKVPKFWRDRSNILYQKKLK